MTNSGTVTRAEFKNFLVKLGNQEPNEKLRKWLGIPKWIKVVSVRGVHLEIQKSELEFDDLKEDEEVELAGDQKRTSSDLKLNGIHIEFLNNDYDPKTDKAGPFATEKGDD